MESIAACSFWARSGQLCWRCGACCGENCLRDQRAGMAVAHQSWCPCPEKDTQRGDGMSLRWSSWHGALVEQQILTELKALASPGDSVFWVQWDRYSDPWSWLHFSPSHRVCPLLSLSSPSLLLHEPFLGYCWDTLHSLFRLDQMSRELLECILYMYVFYVFFSSSLLPCTTLPVIFI